MHKFLSADPARLGRPDVPPCADAVDEALAGGTPEELRTDLIEILGEDVVRHRISDLGRQRDGVRCLQALPSQILQCS